MIKLDNDALVVVTGAAKGNGEAIANAIERAGAKVVRVDLLSINKNKSSFKGTVTDEDLIEQVVDYCSKQKYKSLYC